MSFSSVHEADIHVRAVHAGPRVDELQLGFLRGQSAISTGPQIGQQASQNVGPLSPVPVMPNRCDLCNQFFGSSSDLNVHIQRKHSQPLKSCPISSCQAKFSSDGDLVKHVIAAHQQSQSQATAQQHSNFNQAASSLPPAMANLSISSSIQQNLTSLAAPPSLLNQSSHFGYNPLQASHGPLSQLGKSGQDRLANQRARVHVLWPHECIDAILAKRTYAYKDLTGSALAAGSISSLFYNNEFYQCPESIQVYMEHLNFIFHCLSYSNNVQAILDFHASILSQIEAGILTWSRIHNQTFTLQRLNFRAGLKDIVPSNPSISKASGGKVKSEEEARLQAESHKIICKDFSKGSCSQPSDHDGKRHICHYCYWKRSLKNEVHSPFVCPHDPKRK